MGLLKRRNLGMKPARRILIYRLGSLGDTIVALPALQLVAERFASAERWVLTDIPSGSKVTPMETLLAGTGLVHGYIRYPIATRNMSTLRRIRREIRNLAPDLLVYMAAPRGRMKALRDSVFFKVCGVSRQIGVPYTRRLQLPLRLSRAHYEYEGARLLRCLRKLSPPRELAFDLRLTESEYRTGREAIRSIGDGTRYIAASIGAKRDVQNWGDRKWASLLERLGKRCPGVGLVMGGSGDEWERTEWILSRWPGPVVNLCGQVGVRVFAAVLQGASLYIGHDSGPMHLASAVGTRVVAIFSSRNLPGEWFPPGQNEILYKAMPCQGCQLDTCVERRKACINSVTVEEVEQGALRQLGCGVALGNGLSRTQ